METINITKEEFDSFIPLKRNIVHTDGELVYKKSFFSLRNLELLDILVQVNEINIPSLAFPIANLTVNDKDFGYITKYYKDYYTKDVALKKQKYYFKDKFLVINRLINAVKKMHSEGIVHGDLHEHNIIFNKNDLKIIDFDNMRIKDFSKTNTYRYKNIVDIKYLVVYILNLLSDDNSLDTAFKIIPFIDLLDITNDFKKYLKDCIYEKESIIGFYPDEFISEITGSLEIQAKSLVKGLKYGNY